MSNLNAEEMEEYKKSVLEYEDVQNAIECASKRSEARGEARGEAKAKRTMAFEMLKKGIPLSLISEISGLSETEILSLN